MSNESNTIRYTILDSNHGFHESQGLTESPLRFQLRQLGYDVDDNLPIEDVIDGLHGAYEGLNIEPIVAEPDPTYRIEIRFDFTGTEAEAHIAAQTAASNLNGEVTAIFDEDFEEV